MRLLMGLIILISTATLVATAQISEILHYNGKNYGMNTLPLESYWKDRSERPDKLLKMESTACWRGYLGEWKIKGDKLYLVKITQRHYKKAGNSWKDDGRRAVPLEKIFNRKGMKLPLFAKWYSGIIRIPQGKMTRYVHMGFQSEYSGELKMVIKEGKVIKKKVIDHTIPTPYRSREDKLFVARGDEDEDTFDWIDARLYHSDYLNQYEKNGQQIKIRGIIHFGEENPREITLRIPETEKTEKFKLSFPLLPKQSMKKFGFIPTKWQKSKMFPEMTLPRIIHIEITLNYDLVWELHHIKELKPGQTIHHKDFPKIFKQMKRSKKKGVKIGPQQQAK